MQIESPKIAARTFNLQFAICNLQFTISFARRYRSVPATVYSPLLAPRPHVRHRPPLSRTPRRQAQGPDAVRHRRRSRLAIHGRLAPHAGRPRRKPLRAGHPLQRPHRRRAGDPKLLHAGARRQNQALRNLRHARPRDDRTEGPDRVDGQLRHHLPPGAGKLRDARTPRGAGRGDRARFARRGVGRAGRGLPPRRIFPSCSWSRPPRPASGR